MPPRPWAIIGNPENRRVECFQNALTSRGLPRARVFSYESLLKGGSSLSSLPENAMVRVESPGENLTVEYLLLQAGEPDSVSEGSCIYKGADLLELPREHGRIYAPRQWYLGYVASIRLWATGNTTSPGVVWTTTPDALKTQFDKALCQARCAQIDIPTPRSLGTITGWDELAEKMAAIGMERVFVKLANSSSASGVVALYRRRDHIEAVTSAEMVRSGGDILLYNSLKLHRYTRLDDVRQLIDALARHRAYVEQWLPKASLGRRVFDLRLLIIAGRPRHAVLRTSRTPLTNLHLGNRRGDIDEFWRRLPEQQHHALRETCKRCARLFPDSLHLGLDLLFTPGFRSHYLLEINAFGDLLPNVTHLGVNTYEAQVDAVLSGWPTDSFQP